MNRLLSSAVNLVLALVLGVGLSGCVSTRVRSQAPALGKRSIWKPSRIRWMCRSPIPAMAFWWAATE
jgi:hypothetical protein